AGPLGTGLVTLNGGTLINNGARTIANAVKTNGTVTMDGTSGSSLTLSGPLTSTNTSDTIKIGTSGGTVNIASDISGFYGTFNRPSGASTLNFSASVSDASHAHIVNTGAIQNGTFLRFGDNTQTTATMKFGDL